MRASLAQVVDDRAHRALWEAEHGALTAEEVARAEREMGLAAGDAAA